MYIRTHCRYKLKASWQLSDGLSCNMTPFHASPWVDSMDKNRMCKAQINTKTRSVLQKQCPSQTLNAGRAAACQIDFLHPMVLRGKLNAYLGFDPWAQLAFCLSFSVFFRPTNPQGQISTTRVQTLCCGKGLSVDLLLWFETWLVSRFLTSSDCSPLRKKRYRHDRFESSQSGEP